MVLKRMTLALFCIVSLGSSFCLQGMLSECFVDYQSSVVVKNNHGEKVYIDNPQTLAWCKYNNKFYIPLWFYNCFFNDYRGQGHNESLLIGLEPEWIVIIQKVLLAAHNENGQVDDLINLVIKNNNKEASFKIAFWIISFVSSFKEIQLKTLLAARRADRKMLRLLCLSNKPMAEGVWEALGNVSLSADERRELKMKLYDHDSQEVALSMISSLNLDELE
jgi:hypothetical protein